MLPTSGTTCCLKTREAEELTKMRNVPIWQHRLWVLLRGVMLALVPALANFLAVSNAEGCGYVAALWAISSPISLFLTVWHWPLALAAVIVSVTVTGLCDRLLSARGTVAWLFVTLAATAIAVVIPTLSLPHAHTNPNCAL